MRQKKKLEFLNWSIQDEGKVSHQTFESVEIRMQTAQSVAAFSKQQVLLLKKKATLDLASFKQAVQEVQSLAQRLTYLLHKTERKAQE